MFWNKKIVKGMAGALCVMLVLGAAGSATVYGEEAVQSTSEPIVVDGDISEWEGMESFPVSDGSVSEWKMTKSADGSMVYLCFTGQAKTQWDGHYDWDFVDITYADGQKYSCPMTNLESAWMQPGAKYVAINNAGVSGPGSYYVEIAFPMSETGYSVTFAGTTVAEADIPVFTPVEEVEAVYDGIVIDGKYSDWNGVTMTDAECPNEIHPNCLEKVACIFDGEYVYLYFENGQDGIATGAGPNSNGRYSITTDTGRQLVFQLSTEDGGSVTGIEGAEAAYVGTKWEVAIPASALPEWKENISFGLYQVEPFISNITNLQGMEGTAGEFDGIVYDGLYGDWSAYPHTLIHYATAGTGEDQPDGEGALYYDGELLYAHVESSMEKHLLEGGGEFTSAVSIAFNGEKDYNADKSWNLYPRYVAVAEDGTIDWNPQLKNLPDGEYEFYMLDARGEYDRGRITNIADLEEHEQFLGKMKMRVGEKTDEMEFYVDLEQVATFLSYYSGKDIQASDFKTIEAQFGRIGQDWLSIAGASSGPYLGILLALVVSFGGIAIVKKRHKVVEA